MRLVEFLNQIDEKKRSRPPREMYHGTSSAFLRTILKQGIVPDPKEKKWAEDPHVSSASVSRVSLPGSYWTSNLMTAQSSSTNTTGKFPGNPIIIIAMISEGSAFADEDSITSAIMRGPAEVYRLLFGGGIVADAVPKLLAGIYWGSEANDASIRHMMNDPSKLPKDEVVFGATVRVKDLDLDDEEEFTLVGAGEEDYDSGKILFTSPLAQGLVGKKVGDRVAIDVPQGTLRFEILEIRFES